MTAAEIFLASVLPFLLAALIWTRLERVMAGEVDYERS